jgi:hypothetical protein
LKDFPYALKKIGKVISYTYVCLREIRGANRPGSGKGRCGISASLGKGGGRTADDDQFRGEYEMLDNHLSVRKKF